MNQTTREWRERVAKIITNTFFANHDDRGHPEKACLYWAYYTVEVIETFGIRAIIQAGSASWPRVRPDQDDGVSSTHHSYVWEPDSPITKARVAAHELPELHCWAALPNRGEIIDMTTGYWPEQCQRILGLDWPGDKPPAYFWGTAAELPQSVMYAPDMQAIRLVLGLIKKATGERP
jgi:hypothetical protein